MEKYYYRKNLKYLRKLNSLTQRELGDKMGVDYSTISRWEKGDNDINIDIATKLSKIFDVQTYHFMYSDLATFQGNYKGFKQLFEEDYIISRNDEKALIKTYRELDDKHRERILELMKFYLQEQNS